MGSLLFFKDSDQSLEISLISFCERSQKVKKKYHGFIMEIKRKAKTGGIALIVSFKNSYEKERHCFTVEDQKQVKLGFLSLYKWVLSTITMDNTNLSEETLGAGHNEGIAVGPDSLSDTQLLRKWRVGQHDHTEALEHLFGQLALQQPHWHIGVEFSQLGQANLSAVAAQRCLRQIKL